MKPVVAVLLTCGLLAGCGDQPSDPEPAAETTAEWRTDRLGAKVAVDTAPLLVTDGDDALVLTAIDANTVQSHVSVDGAAFEAGEPVELPLDYPSLVAVRLPDGSWYAVASGARATGGEDEPRAWRPVALRSADGLSWETAELAGFADDAEVHDLAVAGDTIVAVGGYRTEEDPDFGGFEAHTWTSADGRAFTQVDLPGVRPYQGYDDETGAYDVVALGDALLLGGSVDDRATLWSSTDAGRSWQAVDGSGLAHAYAIYGLAAVGGTVYASAPQGDGGTGLVSHDAGRTWTRVAATKGDAEAEAWSPVWSSPDRVFTLTGVDDMTWSRPEVCYADLDQCSYERQPRPRVVASEDGAAWVAVDVPGEDEPSAIAGTADGRTLVLAVVRGGLAVHTWRAGADLPVADDPLGPETVELVTVPEGEEPEVGVRYHAPMYVHCGMDWFWFGDATWRRTDDGPGVETGAGESAPEGWPLGEGQTLYGYATVLEDGTLEYSTEDGTVIATYERRSGAPGCA